MRDNTKRRNINRGYMKLEVWQKSSQLLKLIHSLIDPKKTNFKMTTQILDSTQSISSNIAEGYCRRHLNEYIQYCYIALGSLGETLTRSIGFKEIRAISEWSPTGKPVVPSIYALRATSRYWDEFWNSSTSKDVVFFLSG